MMFKWEDSWQRKVCGNSPEKNILQDRGALPKEGDLVREYKAMPEENFLSSWLSEDVEGKEKRRRNVNKETREEVSRRGKSEGEKGGPKVVVERRCLFGDAVEKFSQGEDSDSWEFVG